MQRFDTVFSVIDLPRLIELTVGEDITSYGCGNSGADLFVCTKCYERLTRFEKAKKNVQCRRYQREICSIYRKVKRQRADELVVLVENVAHAPEQIATTKRAISDKISVSSTPTRSTRLRAKLDKIDIKATLRNQSQIDENIVISRHEFT